MRSDEVLRIYKKVHKTANSSIFSKRFKNDPLKNKKQVASISDAAYGDSGKGAVAAKINRLFVEKNAARIREKLISIGPNGGMNAGHESKIDGKTVTSHVTPLALAQEGATAIISRGKLIHPKDLLEEIEGVKQQLGVSNLPGNLLIDERAVLSLDTHRAFEGALNSFTSGGRGSTGRGIATGYASIYLRHALTIKDLLDAKWKDTFREHYKLYAHLMHGFGDVYQQLNTIQVPSLHGTTKVGSQNEFINRLAETREQIKGYVEKDMFKRLEKGWNSQTPITIEYAQAPGLDPFHGVYPDVTASRPLTRYIADSTYGIIQPEEITFKAGITKTVYMSSVGTRRLPTLMQQREAEQIRKDQHEFGKSTGRPRGIYEISIPILRYYRRVDGYEWLVATHLDAPSEGKEIQVVTHYTDKSGNEMPYSPYQDYFDDLIPHVVSFEGWDGSGLQGISEPADLPLNARKYLAFLSETIAPVAMATTGPDIGQHISWLESLR